MPAVAKGNRHRHEIKTKQAPNQDQTTRPDQSSRGRDGERPLLLATTCLAARAWLNLTLAACTHPALADLSLLSRNLAPIRQQFRVAIALNTSFPSESFKMNHPKPYGPLL